MTGSLMPGGRGEMLVRVLGRLDALDDTGATVRIGGASSRHVLAQLIVHSPGWVARRALIEAGWPGAELAAPEATLRMTVSRLRRALAHPSVVDPIPGSADGYRLDPAVRVDAHELELAVEHARETADIEAAISRLDEALDLWRGEPYAGLEEHLLHGERARLTRLRIEAVERLQRALIEAGRPAEGLTRVQAACADHPLHEGLVALVMTTLYLTGDQTEALALYERTRQRLADELSLSPSPHLAQTQLAILRHEVTADMNPAAASHEPPRTRTRAGPGVRWIVAASLTTGLDQVGSAGGVDAVGVYTERGDTAAISGQWSEAERWYCAAITAALEGDDRVVAADLCLRLAQITWDPSLGETVSQLIRSCLEHLDDDLRMARLRLCLAGGTFRTGSEASKLTDTGAILDDLDVVRRQGTPAERAWATTHARDALVGSVPAETTLELSRQIESLGLTDPFLTAHNARALFSELLRLDRRAAAERVMRSMQRTASPREPAVNAFGRLTARNCWDLALGRFERVRIGLAQTLEFGGRLGAGTLDQVLLGQSYWLTRELGDASSIADQLEGALVLAERDQTSPLWGVAAAVMAVDLGQIDRAAGLLATTSSSFDLADPPLGSHRLPILCFVAEVLAWITATGATPHDPHLARAIADQIADDARPAVLVGWPTVFLGSKHRFIGFALLASGATGQARSHLQRAVHDDRWTPPLLARSLTALAAASAGDDSWQLRNTADAIREALRARARAGTGV
ncbi:MAG: AfsR/SARP family transcriptional regulator [Acidimicrobiales bacterium]|nr:AfsR/SARP family transcriptional regulator [Acidimicrobiales bacterium]